MLRVSELGRSTGFMVKGWWVQCSLGWLLVSKRLLTSKIASVVSPVRLEHDYYLYSIDSLLIIRKRVDCLDIMVYHAQTVY